MHDRVDTIVPPFDKPAAELRDAGVPIRASDEQDSWLKRLRLKYAYFPILRGISYGAESMFTPLSRIIGGKTVKHDPAYKPLVHKLDYLEAEKISDPSYVRGTYTSYTGDVLHEGPGEARVQSLYDKSGLTGPRRNVTQASIAANDAKDTFRQLKDKHERQAKINVSRVETLAFFGWTLINFFTDRKQLKADLSPIVAVETGKDPANITLRDIWSSTNAVAAQSMRRFAMQNIMRSVTDLFFLRNVNWGIGAKAVGVTYERLLTETLLDSLRNQIARVQSNNLGADAEQDITKTLKTILRRSRQFLKLPAMSEEETERLNPVFTKIADAIIHKKLGVREVAYLMGGNITHNPYNIEARVQEVDTLIKIGGISHLRLPEMLAQNLTSSTREASATLSPKIQKIVEQGGQAITPDRIKDLAASPATGVGV